MTPSRRLGKMRYLVDVCAYGKVKDGIGGRTSTLVSFGKSYARIMDPSTRELAQAEKLEVVINRVVVLRFMPHHMEHELYSEGILVHNERTFVVRHGFHDELKRWSYFWCKEEQSR